MTMIRSGVLQDVEKSSWIANILYILKKIIYRKNNIHKNCTDFRMSQSKLNCADDGLE